MRILRSMYCALTLMDSSNAHRLENKVFFSGFLLGKSRVKRISRFTRKKKGCYQYK